MNPLCLKVPALRVDCQADASLDFSIRSTTNLLLDTGFCLDFSYQVNDDLQESSRLHVTNNLTDYVQSLSESVFHKEKPDNNCVNLKSATCVQCDKLQIDLTNVNSDFATVSKLSYHLEKRTQEQEELISLLKQCNIYHNRNAANSIVVAPSLSKNLNPATSYINNNSTSSRDHKKPAMNPLTHSTKR
ncbi:unnamed protein product [Psylliodes chrysocephalus]|uniref:Uncharacterized protein n=1 Tax=Psylliodes chrysocephalus TaxID=3402493 RepID=A0A9P0CPY2_9CUCU|nr:unnamed protein product [Psylliodes chrysocephala]